MVDVRANTGGPANLKQYIVRTKVDDHNDYENDVTKWQMPNDENIAVDSDAHAAADSDDNDILMMVIMTMMMSVMVTIMQ